jgi:hypothetical protein
MVTDSQEGFVPSDTVPEETPAEPEEKRGNRFSRAAEEVEVAAWETVYEVEDLAHEAVEKVKHLGHRQEPEKA